MEFAPEYFKGEIRDGFYVQPLMKRIWAAQLEVLAEIDRICEKHQIKYVATWGTLLGAIRHKGFIPWDDDMDITMLRKDYERFLHYAPKELPKGYSLLDHKDDEFGELLVRITNSTCIDLSEDFLKKYHGCPYIVGIDIFPMDHVPDEQKDEEDLIAVMWMAADIGYNLEEYQAENSDIDQMIKKLEEATGQKIDRKKPLKPQVLHLADRISAMYWDVKTENVAMIWKLLLQPGWKIPRICFEQIIRVPFENTTIPVIKDYDLMLQVSYGKNYMEPLMRANHTYPFVMKQIPEFREFCEKNDTEIPECFHIFGRIEGSPLISVIISCHNAEERIDRCMESLMCQTIAITSLEIVCVDNASTDQTAEKLKAWERKLGNIVTIIACDECGSAGAVKNIGIEYAQADYVTFIDANDWVEMDYCERLYRPVEIEDFDIVTCEYQADTSAALSYFEERGTGKESRSFLIDNEEKRAVFMGLRSMGTEIYGKMIRKDFLSSHHIWFQEQTTKEDAVFTIALHYYVSRLYLHEEKLYHRYIA